MQWNAPRPFGPRALLDRVRLRCAALRYAAHGWAVTPGARLDGHRLDCDRPGCPILGCHPAIESFHDDASADLAQVGAWWRHRPHTVLLATGQRFDVLEVPAPLGLRVLGAARLHAGVLGHRRADPRGPVAVTPAGRWMFLVRPGAPLRAELAERLDVVRHGPGSWIPAAPSRTPDGPVRWAVSPDEARWRLPEAATVQAMLVDALAATGHRPAPVVPAIPRQMSTSRRAA
jgi:Bifunctional DNA primase/polymerase, N-terminal